MEKINQKAYIINYWWSNNYGAILTAYGLQSVLFDYGVQADLVNNKWEYFKKTNKDNRLSLNFANKYCNITNQINANSDYLKLNNDGEIFITGSDQVFRIGKNLTDIYENFLTFTDGDKKKIAFSASFGIDKENFVKNTTQINIDKVKQILQTFDLISVREKSGVEICKDIFDIDAEWIIDPVFIYNDWNKLLDAATQSYKNKIVSYVLDPGGKYNKAYKYLSKIYNCKVVETANSNISVENWLKSIKDCELFVTDSFHGMCFAVIFNKPFICVGNKTRGKARFDSICEMLAIENRCINSIDEIYENDCIFKIDYNKVNIKIDEKRQEGLIFLQKAIETTCEKHKEKKEVRTKYLEQKIAELEIQANLNYQIKKELWNLWLEFWHKYLPKPLKSLINILWGKKTNV